MPLQDKHTEYYVTLFDSRFLLFGLALHASLQAVSSNAHLWVICLDEAVADQINKMKLSRVSTIPLHTIENDALLAIKATRTTGEYCWTLTPFAPQAVFDLVADAERVTYLDSDLFFFSSPDTFFQEFEASNKHVLITEHAYAPEYDRTKLSGRFCVQFMTFRRSAPSFSVMKWWQDRCLEWCFDRNEDGKFGDQKYLDQWPSLFGREIHILRQVEKTLAPWNVDYFLSKNPPLQAPVFYHFQSFRIVGEKLARLYVGVKIGKKAQEFYEVYLQEICRQIAVMRQHGIALSEMPEPKRHFSFLRKIYMKMSNKVRYSSLEI